MCCLSSSVIFDQWRQYWIRKNNLYHQIYVECTTDVNSICRTAGAVSCCHLCIRFPYVILVAFYEVLQIHYLVVYEQLFSTVSDLFQCSGFAQAKIIAKNSFLSTSHLHSVKCHLCLSNLLFIVHHIASS